MKGRLQKKLFGIGVMGPAFLGGAGFGFGAGLLSYSILHRYLYMRRIMFERKWIEDWDKQYYDNFYERWVSDSLMQCVYMSKLFPGTIARILVQKTLTVSGVFVSVIGAL